MTRIVEKLSSANDFLPDPRSPSRETEAALAALLTGLPASQVPELPPQADLIGALGALAERSRRKVLLPLGSLPIEYALVRRGEDLSISVYGTGAAPEVVVYERSLPLAMALAAVAAAAPERLAARARLALAELVGDPRPPTPIMIGGGVEDDPGEHVALGFGFSVELVPDGDAPEGASARADVHALLHQGKIWAFSRGRRFAIAQGPVLLAVARLVAAVRALVEAHSSSRPVHVRLRSGAFVVALRLSRTGEVALTVGPSDDRALTVPALDVAGACMPILRLGSEIVRAVCTADRSQRRNLRLLALRDEVRALRRTLKARARADGFVNRDAERLRLAQGSTPPESDETPISLAGTMMAPARLRFAPRWTTEIEGLDATSTFLCGDRLVVASQRRVVALGREGGEVLWARRAPRAASMMVGTQLARLAPDGTLEVWDVAEGEVTARTRLAPRAGGSPSCLYLGGGTLPPAALISEGTTRLCAVDLRNGEPRWRFAAREGAFRLRRAGRVLLVVSGEAAVHALDVVTGEVLWRYANGARFTLAPAVSRDVAVLVSGDASSGTGVLHGVDLFSGRLAWRRELDAAPLAAPVVAGELVCIPFGAQHPLLAACNPHDGSLAWMAPDPGLGRGGAALAVDRALVVNAPGGRASSLDLATGATRWSQALAKSSHDDVPRRLEPVLRHGALFVPGSAVHVLRPSDGERLGGALDCDLIPDVLRVDERGWLYVGEESGHLRAYAPLPQLALVRGGNA